MPKGIVKTSEATFMNDTMLKNIVTLDRPWDEKPS